MEPFVFLGGQQNWSLVNGFSRTLQLLEDMELENVVKRMELKSLALLLGSLYWLSH